MRDHGVLLTLNQFEPQFLSAAHTEADVEETLEAYKDALGTSWRTGAQPPAEGARWLACRTK